METYFNLIPRELLKLILVKANHKMVLCNLRDISDFKDIMDSHDFWRDLFNISDFVDYMYQGLFNKDIEYLLKGVQYVIKSYEKYKPNQLFDMYNFEYTNILTVYSYMKYLFEKLYFSLEVSMDYVTDTTLLQDNLNIDIHEKNLNDSKEFPPFYYGILEMASRDVHESVPCDFIILIKKIDTEYAIDLMVRKNVGFNIYEIELKNSDRSFKNILMYVLYRRPKLEINV